MPIQTLTDNPRQRETFVVELECQEAVGTDQEGLRKVHAYVEDLAQKFGRQILETRDEKYIETHVSPLYGLAGWACLEGGVRIHIYAWDRPRLFVSVDISCPQPLSEELKDFALRSTDAHFVGTPDHITYKSTWDSSEWRPLAPEIIRQRLYIAGQIGEPLSQEMVKNYLHELSHQLDMHQLAPPVFSKFEDNAWMHWETSGAIMSWDNLRGETSIEIYTCKTFSNEDALSYTRDTLNLHTIFSQPF